MELKNNSAIEQKQQNIPAAPDDIVSLSNANRLQSALLRDDSLEQLQKIMPINCGLAPRRLVIAFFESLRATLERQRESVSAQSLRSTLNRFALFGLDPLPNNPEGFIEIRKGEAKFSLSYQGAVRLAKRSGKILDIDAWGIHENDTIHIEKGDNQSLSYVPALKNPGRVYAYVAHAALTNGWHKIVTMTIDEIESCRKQSKNTSPSSPWRTHYDRMARKTVIWRLCKDLDISTEDMNMAFMDATWEESQPDGPERPKAKQLMAKLRPQPTKEKIIQATTGVVEIEAEIIGQETGETNDRQQ
jgi:phage RecT family recombinase